VIGQTLNSDRSQGDVIRMSQLGELITLQPNERAIAVHVTDASGMGGLLHTGQLVGVVAIVPHQSFESNGTFSKATLENLRVLYIDPDFEASVDQAQPASTPAAGASLTTGSGGGFTADRAGEGTIILAVPVDMQSIFYDFAATGAISETRTVNALELLAILNATDGAEISLYLMPGQDAAAFTSPGLWLPDLVITPAPTATPTPTPIGHPQ
jgi:hypothetical protein